MSVGWINSGLIRKRGGAELPVDVFGIGVVGRRVAGGHGGHVAVGVGDVGELRRARYLRRPGRAAIVPVGMRDQIFADFTGNSVGEGTDVKNVGDVIVIIRIAAGGRILGGEGRNGVVILPGVRQQNVNPRCAAGFLIVNVAR